MQDDNLTTIDDSLKNSPYCRSDSDEHCDESRADDKEGGSADSDVVLVLDRWSISVGYRVVRVRWIMCWNTTTARWSVGGLLTVDVDEAGVSRL
jgi:hypothetical protein